jgi:hypothetical protein
MKKTGHEKSRDTTPLTAVFRARIRTKFASGAGYVGRLERIYRYVSIDLQSYSSLVTVFRALKQSYVSKLFISFHFY